MAGSVHGVVVQAASTSPVVAPASSRSSKPTVSAGSWRSRYTSSMRVSVLLSGVSHRQQYASTLKPSYTRSRSHSDLNAHMTLSM